MTTFTIKLTDEKEIKTFVGILKALGIKAKKTEDDNSYTFEELKEEIEKARKDLETGKLKPTTTEELWASID
ncbi:hypothetical protein [Chryseobacterium caseinilyticum]|uniref:Uncharacterized protein n=1 Tax=Chryseobacterium caseinilyticum TaxID=2771428 RepID=A0ABR8ZFB8_9FLAO|nr:hypothetical protein [Chryseobacterium caseinilyticum]MBD8083411.1 hypothetical protein [Chryseobacterium caseinilyticum]